MTTSPLQASSVFSLPQVAGEFLAAGSVAKNADPSDDTRARLQAAHEALSAMTPPPPTIRSMAGRVRRPPQAPKTAVTVSSVPVESGAEIVSRRLDFLNLGIVLRDDLTGEGRPVSKARQNTLTYLLRQYQAQGLLYQLKSESACYTVLRRLLEALAVKPDRIQLHVVEDSDPNAFWVVGTGAIFVTTALLEKPNLTEGELASVLAHELGHFLKYRANSVLPKRFKNPLFRKFVLETHAAQRQNEEYEADELALLILDAAGYSVAEALRMEQWIAGEEGKAKPSSTSGAKVLRPHESHPHGHARVAAVSAAIDNPCFVWKNRAVAATPLAFATRDLTLLKSKAVRNFRDSLNPLDKNTVAAIAKNPKHFGQILAGENIICLLFNFLKNHVIEPTPECRDAIRRLRAEAEHGDIIASAYLKALLAKLYLDAVKEGPEAVAARLAWLEESCQISRDEVLLSLVEYLESVGLFIEKILSYEWSEEEDSPSTSILTLEDVVSGFSHSGLRDQLISALLRFKGFIKDQSKYIEDHAFSGSKSVGLPIEGDLFKFEGLLELLPLLHGTSVVQTHDGYFFRHPEFDKIAEDSIKGNAYENIVKVTLTDSSFTLFFFMRLVHLCALPYDRGELEELLEDGIGSFLSIDSSFVQNRICSVYRQLAEAANEFKLSFSRERVLGVARIIVLRFMEAIPVPKWETESISLIEAMAPSSERNHLLILLDKNGRRAVQAEELVFREIPSPDEAGAEGGDVSFLHSFGFVATADTEVIYPSGQRVLDRFQAESLPASGALRFAEIIQKIPRPSPIRDELLNRCEAETVSAALTLLDAYWSPAAAYAKAFEISSQWLEVHGGKSEALQAILDITGEFPSLRRRMVRAWADRFGVHAREYENFLKAIYDVDAIDLYRGAAMEHSRRAPGVAKAGICLASFASALMRGNHSLLSLQDLDGTSQTDTDEFLGEDEVRLAIKTMQRVTVQLIRKDIFAHYYPFLPENALSIIDILAQHTRYDLHRISFVNGRPLPNPRFSRNILAQKGMTEWSRWEGKEAFSCFMKAMGWSEAVSFYEELFLGRDGIVQHSQLFAQMEDIFLEGISLLLEDKGVSLARVQNVKKGLKIFLAYQSPEIRGKIWARILAGIAQQSSMGEIVREAVKPLGAALGGKLMQAVYSLTAGVDATLEEATRLALDQTTAFDLFEALRFLGSRDILPFEHHERYHLLGQGSVRAAIAGRGGSVEDSAYLLVHALPLDAQIVEAVKRFIVDLTRRGEYFPLTPSQFEGLVAQTDDERRRGFQNHQKFGELHDWHLGDVRIPHVLEIHGDWARMEIVAGRAYPTLPEGIRPAVSTLVIGAALAQLRKLTDTGEIWINPETHGGNILYDAESDEAWLVDCGLLGAATMADVLTLAQIHAAFATRGLSGAIQVLLMKHGVQNLDTIPSHARGFLFARLHVLEDQLREGTAPELLLPSLADIVHQSLNKKSDPGLDVLFRALQHLAPYLHETQDSPALGSFFPGLNFDGFEALAAEIEKEMRNGKEDESETSLKPIPQGVGVGQMTRGSIHSLGVLKMALDPAAVATTGDEKGLLVCVLEGRRVYVRPENLRIQVAQYGQNQWVTVEEWRKS